MKQEVNTQSVESVGGQRAQMTILANSKAFRILVDQIYQNKALATIAELSQNAYDAHLNIGKNEPFDVILPSRLNESLIIRDYGCGMSHEFMLDGYTKVFNSTKDQTDSENGAFGLGRLSPLSLCDNYIITCFDGKEKRIYDVTLHSGIPEVIFMGKSACNEERGVEVKVGIRRENIHEIYSAVKNVYKYYPVKPKLINGAACGVEIPEVKYSLFEEDENGGIKWGFDTGGHGAKIIMGLYPYPINPSFFNEFSALINSSIVIYAPLGSIDIVPSREALEYTKKTKDYLRVRCKETLDNIQKEFDKKVCAEKSCWKANKTYIENHSLFGRFVNNTQIKKTLPSGHEVEICGQIKADEHFLGFGINSISYRKRLKSNKYKKIGNAFTGLHVGQNNILVKNESSIKKLPLSRFAQWYAESKGSLRDVVFIQVRDFDAFVKEYGLEELPVLEDIYNQMPPDYGKIVKSRTVYSKCLKVGGYGNYEETEIDLKNDEFVYFPIKYGRFDGYNKHGIDSCDIKFRTQACDTILKLNRVIPNLIFIKSLNESWIEGNNKAVHINDYLTNLFDKFKKDEIVNYRKWHYLSDLEYMGPFLNRLFERKNIKFHLPKVREYDEDLYNLIKLFEDNNKIKPPKFTASKSFKNKIYKIEPVLGLVNAPESWQSNFNKLIEYVENKANKLN